MPLTDAGRDHVLDEWARRLTVDAEVVRVTGTTYVTRADADAVVVVDLGSARVVLGPAPALTLLRAIVLTRLLELSAVLRVLAPLRAQPLGVGTLGYLDVVPDRPTSGVGTATADVVEELRTHCSEDEWAECGLVDMEHRWVCRSEGGAPAAVAGHEPWGAHVAHLGVLCHPAQRGHGFARTAAAAAIGDAVAGGRVAQWRCRVDNMSSQRLAGRLGFVPLGRQLAVLLHDRG